MTEILSPVNDLLQLHNNERVILSLIDKHTTPLELARNSKIPRPTIYLTLEKLKARGLIKRKKEHHKIFWIKVPDKELQYNLQELQKNLISEETGEEKILLEEKTQIIIHRGKDSIIRAFENILTQSTKERLIIIQGDDSGKAWDKNFGLENINRFNNIIKEQGIITELITSKKCFTDQVTQFGLDWAKTYEGRSTRVQNIYSKYLSYSSQVFIFKNQVFLISMIDKVFIEINNEQISKLLVSFSRFIQDHSEIFDVNMLLREQLNKKNVV